MDTLKFKTNMKCDGCVSTVTPHLNKLIDVESWQVDLTSPEKTLTVNGKEGIRTQEVISALEQAGFKAEEI
jgi:copper chaperone